jgi:hypothetical protein
MMIGNIRTPSMQPIPLYTTSPLRTYRHTDDSVAGATAKVAQCISTSSSKASATGAGPSVRLSELK